MGTIRNMSTRIESLERTTSSNSGSGSGGGGRSPTRRPSIDNSRRPSLGEVSTYSNTSIEGNSTPIQSIQRPVPVPNVDYGSERINSGNGDNGGRGNSGDPATPSIDMNRITSRSTPTLDTSNTT